MSIEDKFEDFFKKAKETANVIKEETKNNGQIRIISHLDTDGITAAGIIGSALYRAEASFHIRIIRQLEEQIMEFLSEGRDHVNLFVFTDLGSGQLPIIVQYLDIEKSKVIILDHHPPVGDDKRIFQLNPHLFGIDGSTMISGAGVSYFVAKAMDVNNIDLSALAAVGAIGDRQDKGEQGSFTGLNAKIVEDAVNAKVLEFKKDLRLFGRETRPVHIALEYTTDPYIPGITGNRDACFKLLVELQIPLKKGDEWRTIADLTIDERTKLVSALITRSLQQGVPSEEAQSIVGNVYTLLSEKGGILRDAREFASCLNACGRMGRAGVGVALCLGDRERAYKDAEEILSNYRTRLSDYLTLLSENTERITDLKHVQIFDGKELVDDRIIGTIVSLARSSNILSSDKIVFGIARQEGEDFVKISGRSTQKLVDMGIDIGKALSEAAEHIEGAEAGGHDIAAGARVPIEKEHEFLQLVCDNIDKQFAKLGLVKNDQAE